AQYVRALHIARRARPIEARSATAPRHGDWMRPIQRYAPAALNTRWATPHGERTQSPRIRYPYIRVRCSDQSTGRSEGAYRDVDEHLGRRLRSADGGQGGRGHLQALEPLRGALGRESGRAVHLRLSTLRQVTRDFRKAGQLTGIIPQRRDDHVGPEI